MNAQIKPNQSSNSSTIVAVVLLIISVVGVLMFLLPQKDKLEEVKVDLSSKQTQLQKTKAEIVRLENLKDSFEGSEVTMNDVLNLIPAEIEESEVIKTFGKLTTENDISINSISFGQAEESELEVNKLNITTNLSGGHQSLIKFMEALEAESRKFVVKTISVQTLQNTLENMTLTIEAYYL